MTEAEARAWASISQSIGQFSKQQLHKLKKLANRELGARWQAKEALNKRVAGGFGAMANFMAGVTWALACRAALRQSKEHAGFGKRPQSGEMWLPRELLFAVRSQVRGRGWHPITAKDWPTVQAGLAQEQRGFHHQLDDGEFSPTGRMSAVKFVIPFARQEASAVIAVNKRFDDSFDHWDDLKVRQ
jgi:hypothetical protein